jgi:flagella basal body P-ring formation protein FlgA
MTRRTLLTLAGFALLTLWLSGASAALMAQRPADVGEPVTIVLLAEAVIDDTLITLDHIAKLSGGPDTLRQRLAKLDIAEFKLGADHMVVLSDQVRFRLLLAGVAPASFRLQGARRTNVVESDEPATVRRILSAAQQELRACYPGNGRVAITAPRAIDVPAVDVRPGERVRLAARTKGPLPIAGRAVVDVAVVVNGKAREVVQVVCQVAEAESTPIYLARERTAIRPALYSAPVPAAAPPDARPALIKTRDSVKLIALIGPARVEALGEATQDGRVGEMIRVRNVESGRIVHGRVESDGTVLVDY